MRPQRNILIVLLLFAGACGASAHQKALRATFSTVNTISKGFTTYSHDHQQKIVADAKTPEEGKAALLAFRAKRDRMVLVFDDVYRALVAAVLAEDTGSLDAAQKAIERLQKAFDDLKKVDPS